MRLLLHKKDIENIEDGIIIALGQLQDIKTILRAIKRKFVDEVDE